MGFHELIQVILKTKGGVMTKAKSGVSAIGTARTFLKEGT